MSFYIAENSRSFIYHLMTRWLRDDAQVNTFHHAMTGAVLTSLPGVRGLVLLR